MGHVLGTEKGNFLIRGDDGAMSMAAAPVESCQSLSNRSPWGRLGSVLYTCKRLRCVRRRFNHFWSISLSRPLALAIFRPRFCFQSSPRALGRRIDDVCGAGDHPPPDLPRETSTGRSAPEKSVQFGPDGDPFPSKTSITRGPPGIVITVSLDPILPHR